MKTHVIRKTQTALACLFLLTFTQFALAVSTRVSFEEFDTNKDGVISPTEFVERQNQDILQKGAALADKDSYTPMDRFIDFDRNSDSQITRDEFSVQQQRTQTTLKRPNKGRQMPTFSDFDLNGDGRLEEAEFYQARNDRMTERARSGFPMRNAASAPTFEDVDLNNDQSIDREEFSKHQLEHWKRNRKW